MKTPKVTRGRYATSSDQAPRPRRRKRNGDEAREEGLIAARALLLEGGPGAVTVANVGKQIGMSHANVLHHFGSAAGLQSALMGSMVRDLTSAIDETVERIRNDEGAPRLVVDQVFDAFDKGGAGQLAAWIALARDFRHLEPVRDAVQALVSAFKEKFSGPDSDSHIRGAVLTVAICAFGDAVIGPHLREMLGQSDEEMRDITAKILPVLMMQTK